ncbi:hypothetical protein SAMN04488139_2509 [Pseudidiomarina donghaiensis]|nr:hypothetical protein SAMN04488139_2509 [Pseudidiomarina donghaiensis]
MGYSAAATRRGTPGYGDALRRCALPGVERRATGFLGEQGLSKGAQF